MKVRSWLQLALVGVLIVSMVTNVFLLGYLARDGGEPSEATRWNLGQIYPAEVRSEFREILRENRPRTTVALEALRQARRNLESVVNATPLDAAAAQGAMEDVRRATNELQRLMHQLLLEALKQARGA